MLGLVRGVNLMAGLATATLGVFVNVGVMKVAVAIAEIGKRRG